jgi:hypothetical protein
MGKLRSYEAAPWPRIGGWLVPGDNCTLLGYRIVQRMFPDIGVMERPLGSNKTERLRRMCARFNYPYPIKWCGLEVGAAWIDCGAMVPQDFPSVDAWLEHMVPLKKVAKIDLPGAAAVFGKPGDGQHIEVITRWETEPDFLAMTVGGNKRVAGAPPSDINNGIGVGMDIMARKDLLGIVVPQLSGGLSEPLPVDFK